MKIQVRILKLSQSEKISVSRKIRKERKNIVINGLKPEKLSELCDLAEFLKKFQFPLREYSLVKVKLCNFLEMIICWFCPPLPPV
jgi:hypothetical protein